MATTENLYTGNGSTVLYSFTFPYLNTTDVKVTLDGTATTAYTLANATQVQFTTAPASGVAIRIYRETASDELSASFFSGASIRANDLNNNFLQNLYVTQETEFDVNTANTTADSAKATADSAVVTANSAASDAASAVSTANTANTNATAAQTAATNAAASASAAQTSATAAQTSATAAQTSASSAQASATAAASDAASALSTANTANTNASAAVTTANTASSTASSAVTTANTANTNATAAQTAASNAATDASNAQSSASAAQTSATAAQNSATAAAASAAASQNVADAFTATGTPATALSVDVPIDVANGVKLPTNSNSYDEEGAIRYNTTLDKIEIRKGSGWSTAAGGATVSSTPPTLATAGDVWYDHDNGRAYVYYNDGDSNQWVEMNPSWNGYVSDNSVTSAKIVDGTIVNADINASAAIAGTKIDPNFGSQTIETTGVFSAADGAAATPSITFTGDTNTGIYRPGADQLAISTNGTGRLFVDASGNVGIGTSSPSSLLHLAGNANSAQFDSSTGVYLTFKHNGTAVGYIGSANQAYTGGATGDIAIAGGSGSSLTFATANTERMRIDSSGRLLVGTSSATNNLRINESFGVVAKGSNVYGGLSITNYSGPFTGARPLIDFNRSAGTSDGSFTVVGNNYDLGSVIFRGADGSQFLDGAEIRATIDGTPGANDMPTRLVFSTTADGASSPTTRMIITSAGNTHFAASTSTFNNGVLINASSSRVAGNFGSGGGLELNGFDSATNGGRIFVAGSTRGDGRADRIEIVPGSNGVYLASGGTSWISLSDERYKTNLIEIENGLNKVASLRAVTGRYIEDDETVSRAFLIAQDVLQVLPEAVDLSKDSEGNTLPLGLQYTDTIPLLVSALKESKERIEQLEASNADLLARVTALETA